MFYINVVQDFPFEQCDKDLEIYFTSVFTPYDWKVTKFCFGFAKTLLRLNGTVYSPPSFAKHELNATLASGVSVYERWLMITVDRTSDKESFDFDIWHLQSHFLRNDPRHEAQT